MYIRAFRGRRFAAFGRSSKAHISFCIHDMHIFVKFSINMYHVYVTSLVANGRADIRRYVSLEFE